MENTELSTLLVEQSPQHACDKNVQVSKENATTDKRKVLSYFKGWQGLAKLSLIVTSIAFVANMSLLIAAEATDKRKRFDGIRQLYSGSCSRSNSLFIISHFFINVCSTLLLAASGSCTQILGSPNRQEVDRAHAKKRWVHIGLFGLRNFHHVSIKRILLVLVLLLSSIPLHLFYNATIFASGFSVLFVAYGVDNRFASEASFSLPGAALESSTEDTARDSAILTDLRNDLLSGQLEQVQDLQDCAQFDGRNVSESADLFDAYLLISDTNNSNSSVFALSNRLTFYFEDKDLMVNPWTNETDSRYLGRYQPSNEGQKISTCYGRRISGQCGVFLIRTNLIIVIICNAIKIICIALYTRSTHRPLITTGDTVASFVDSEDKLLRDTEPVSISHIRNRGQRASAWLSWPKKKMAMLNLSWWISASSTSNWLIPLIIWLILVIFWAFEISNFYLLLEFITGSPADSTWGDIEYNKAIKKGLGATGFGSSGLLIYARLAGVNEAYDSGQRQNSGFASTALSANWIQLLISFLYVGLNRTLTSMLLSKEYCDFGLHRKKLRLSFAEAGQRASYWLNIPAKFALPNMAVWVLLHWFASQMVYLISALVVDTYHDPDGSLDLIVRFSDSASIAFIVLGTIIFLLTFVIGFRKFPPGIPVAGTCSAAIASACHPGPDEPPHASQFPLKFDAQHIKAFTARPTEDEHYFAVARESVPVKAVERPGRAGFTRVPSKEFEGGVTSAASYHQVE